MNIVGLQMEGKSEKSYVVLNPPVKFQYGLIEYFRNIIHSKEMMMQFVKRDFRIKYRGSVLGYLWSLLGPILHCMVYYTLIVLIRGGGYARQPLWLFGGIILFQFFRETLEGGMRSLISNQGLIKRIYFPREIFATSNMVSKLIFLMFATVPLFPLLYYYGFEINYNQLYVFPAIFGLSILALGMGFLLSCAHTTYADVGLFMKYLLTFLFFLSPILWTLDNIPEEWLEMYLAINPVAVFLTMFRYGLDGTTLPIGAIIMARAFVTSILILITGISVFKKFEGSVIRHI